jgi:hypothetical protein
MSGDGNIPGKPKGALGDLVKAETLIQLAIALPIGCLVGALLGSVIDRHFGTRAWAIVGIVIGAVGGFLKIFQTANKYMKDPNEMEQALVNFSDADARSVIVRAVRLIAVLAVVCLPLALWKGGWKAGVLLLIGAAVSASGIWEWRRLMAALVVRMEPLEGEHIVGARRPSIGFVVVGFFLRLFAVLVVLYVSLKYLNGSVLALAAGLAMGVIALTIEGLQLLRSGTI